MSTTERAFPTLVRRFINEALDDDAIRTLCFDHFRPVYDELAPAMSRTECIRRLVHWCERNRAFDRLLTLAGRANPAAYGEYVEQFDAVPENLRYPAAPESLTNDAMALLPCIVHPLPPAPEFVGRERELAALRSFWENRTPGARSLSGLGGAGKTAITARFLDDLLASDEQKPGALFVWSFYVDQDVNAFLEAAYYYFGRGHGAGGSGVGTYYLLLDALQRAPRPLIVLDGLERVQRARSDKSGHFGDLTDPLLGQVVTRLAAGLGAVKCLITTRFPLPGLDTWQRRSFAVVDVDQLEQADARSLLRRHGLKGDDNALDALIETFGAHALTLDHLGGYLAEYCNGDPESARSLPEPDIDSTELQERRLARVLHAYDKALSPAEHALLSRLSIFRFGTTLQRLQTIFSGSETRDIAGPLAGLPGTEFKKMMQHLVRLHLALEMHGGEYTAHPAVLDHFYRAFVDPRMLHRAVRRHFSLLVDKPGTDLPTSVATIELLEELVHHTLRAGDVKEASEIYHLRLGGYQHLAWNQGQYSRCIRVLTEFPRCPDPAGLVWCYRALGDLDAAEKAVDSDDEWWLGMIASLRGRFAEAVRILTNEQQDALRLIACFMSGSATADSLERAPIWPGLPVTLVDCYLMADRVLEAKQCLDRTRRQLPQAETWNDEVARLDVLQAEVERRSGNRSTCRALLEKATQWITRSGSQEHLCALHLGKARLAIDEHSFDLARTAVEEGLHIADSCGLGFYMAELRIVQAELLIDTGAHAEALDSATTARNGILRTTREAPQRCDADLPTLLVAGADHPRCQNVWATSKAGLLQARALLSLGKPLDAAAVLKSILGLQQRIHHPHLAGTESLLASLSTQGQS